MAKSLKKQKLKSKINKSQLEFDKGSDCEQFPSFSFKHLTNNKKFNLEYFKETDKKKTEILKVLLYRMKEISENDYVYWRNKKKEHGFETIEYSRIKFEPKNKNNLNISKDTKIIIFRFYQQNCRILGVREKSCPVFHIIGFDFNFSAYDHG